MRSETLGRRNAALVQSTELDHSSRFSEIEDPRDDYHEQAALGKSTPGRRA